MPQHLWTGVGQTAKVAKSLATGEGVPVSSTGKQANIMDLTKYFLAPLGMQTVDQIALAEGLERRTNAKLRQSGMRAAQYRAGVPLDLPPEVRGKMLSEAAINAQSKLKQIELSAALAYGNADPRQVAEARQLVEQRRKQALQARAIGESPVDVLFQEVDNGKLRAVIDAIRASIDELAQEHLNERNDTNAPDGTGTGAADRPL
jgi:hypothetical protein